MNWTGYDANIKEYFGKRREDQRLFDVTLATDDGQHIQAHKIILSAGSDFFNDIFMKSNHNNMLVYLKGISIDRLEPILDFIYNGETFITQEQLNVFIETGKELKVKGLVLDGDLTGAAENSIENAINPQESENKYDNCEEEKVFAVLADKTVPQIDEENLQLKTNDELDLKITEMIERNEGVWKCKICGKTSKSNTDISRHAETHIKGMSHACHLCSKTFPSRPNLRNHISFIHSELFSCDICGKSEMSRTTYRDHKRKNH